MEKILLSEVRKMTNLTKQDFSLLLNIDKNTYPHYELGRHKCPKDTVERILNGIKQINEKGKREALFNSKKNRALNEDLLFIRGARLFLNFPLKELAKTLQTNDSNLNNVENGSISNSSRMRDRIREKLKLYAKNKNIDWEEVENRANNFVKEEKERWESASEYDKIIDLRYSKSKGSEFESKVAKILENTGFFTDVMKNVMLSNKELNIKAEADIYAVKRLSNKLQFDILIECKSRKDRGLGPKGLVGYARELAFVKNFTKVNEAILVTDVDFSEITESNIKSLGIHILKDNQLEEFLDVRNMGGGL